MARRSISDGRGARHWIRRLCLCIGALALGTRVVVPATAPATPIENQARLPPAVACDDPVVGRWKAHVYYRHVRQWYVFTLDIRRAEAGRGLNGEIRVLFWSGRPIEPEPRPCWDGRGPASIVQAATGTYEAGRLRFEGTSIRCDRRECYCTDKYAADRFSGAIDPERQEFQAVLDSDIPGWQELPTVFRRISCGETPRPSKPRPKRDEARPAPTVDPPPSPSRQRESGCGC